MRLIIAFTLSFFVTTLSYSQWQGTNPVYFTAGSVGVGTSSPSFKFHIRGSNANSDLMTLGSTTTGNFALTSSDGGAYGLFGGVSSTGRAWLQAGRYDSNLAYDLSLQASGGNVGIGTTSPNYKLEVNGSVLQRAENSALGIDDGTNARLGFIKKSGYWPLIASGTSTPIVFAHTSEAGIHSNIASASLTERMRIDVNGNVGIGSSNPQVKLDIGSTQGSGLQFRYDGTTNYRTQLVPYWNNGTDTRLDFNIGYVAGQAPKTIMSVGHGYNVGIGTTAPLYKLDITNPSGESQNLFRIRVDGAPNDNLTIGNATGAPGQFIPNIAGYHTSANRQALYLSGTIEPANDTGTEPIMVFDSRLSNAPTVTRPLFAWDSYGNRKMTLSSSGSLGIGTTSPVSLLTLNKSGSGAQTSELTIQSNWTNVARFGWNAGGYVDISSLYNNNHIVLSPTGTGNVGIGTTAPDSKLDVTNNFDGSIWNLQIANEHHDPAGDQSVGMKFKLGDASEPNKWSGILGVSEGAWENFVGLSFYTTGSATGTQNTEKMRITSNGNVGIGTSIPDTKLTVKGIIHTEEVRVDLNVPGPDYVFEKDYDLTSLSELETYITQHKHLPEVPSAKEMEANGLNLKEMNLLLLKKVEELTLHLIRLEKENKKQSEQNSEQQKEIEILKSKIK